MPDHRANPGTRPKVRRSPREREGARGASQAGACSLAAGDQVFCPHHGIGVIRERRQRQVLGRRRDYLTIDVAQAGMRIMLPADAAARTGVRSPSSAAEAAEALAGLASPPAPMPDNWRARTKDSEAKLASGRITALVEVVRDLAARQLSHRLAAKERELFLRARELLTGDIMAALDLDEAAVTARIDDAVGTT
jgi:CarD family transcriptional regulator